MKYSLLVLPLLAMASSIANANPSQNKDPEIERLSKELAAVESHASMGKSLGSTLPPRCVSFPITTNPVGPSVTRRFRGPDGSVDMTFWRKACDGSTSIPMVTIKPVSGEGVFICPQINGFQLTQNGHQAHNFIIRVSDEATSLCWNVYAPVTGWLTPSMNPAFDPNAAFNVYAPDLSGSVAVPAYDPTAYNYKPHPIQIDHFYSGAWYDRYGEVMNQGWFLEFNKETKTAIGSWFTGNEDATQLMWYTMQGSYSGNVAKMKIFRTRYVTFGGSTGVTTETGDITFTFNDCDSAKVEWKFNAAGSEKETMDINRIIAAPEGCDAIPD